MNKPSRSGPKRHHYVPRLILKRFVDSEGWLFVYSREQPSVGVRPSRIENAFVRTHLYSTQGVDGSKDPAAEISLSSIEAEAEPVVDRLLTMARREEPPYISDVDREVWCRFLLAQWKRVPDLHKTVTTNGEVSAKFDEIILGMRTRYPNRDDDLDELERDREIIIRNARVRAVVADAPLSMPVLIRRKIRILRIRAPGKRLVIGSRPVVQMNFKGRDTLVDPATEMWLPVASDLAIGVGDGVTDELLFMDKSEGVRALNVAIARQSTEFASADPTLTRSLIRPR